MHSGTSFRTKIFLCMLFAILAALSLPLLYARMSLNDQLLGDAQRQVLREAHMAARLLAAHQESSQREALIYSLHSPDLRLTLLNPQGQVLADSSMQPGSLTTLDNHADRPEFQAAHQGGEGLSVRFSNTLNLHTIYAAVLLEDGHMLRVAVPFAGIKSHMESQLTNFSLVALVAVLLAMALAYFLSSRLEHSLYQMVKVVEAISLGKYQRRLRTVPGSEFTALADAVNRMAENIEHHVHTVADQKSQLHSILETMDDGVLVLDAKGRIRSCNRALGDLFPAVRGGMGLPVVEVIPTPALHEAVEALLQEPEADEIPPEFPHVQASHASRTLQLEFPDGVILAVQLARPLILTPQLGAVIVFHDISSLIRLERVRRDFVTNVSHELRTPLTAVQGYAETLAAWEEMPEDARRFAEIIHKHSLYLGRMVEELLSLARLENDAAPLPVQVTSLEDALQSAVSLCQRALNARQLQVESQTPSGDLVMVLADPTCLVQVLRNLLENACRYAPEASAIVLRVKKMQSFACVSVSDNGPGIPPQDLDRIFERFYRVDKQRATASTGLGLAICKHIIERHQGRIWAESPAREAATSFYFTLPLA